METSVVKASKYKNVPSATMLRDFLRQMLLIRRVEERSAQLYGQGKIGGFCHLYIGQEAVAVGTQGALRPDDYTITTYRDHGLALVRGVSAAGVLGELMGREIGCARGRGGSMHMFDKEKGLMGGHGIVGAHLPLAAGAAFAAKYRGEDKVCVCFFGDGAINNGCFHEAMNLAAIWNLPVVFICENNKYSMGTAMERVTAGEELHLKAEAYNMRHDWIDGMDVLAFYSKMKDVIDSARQGEPWLIEARTYRYRGHSMSDPGTYRSKDEVEEQKKYDPIEQLKAYMIEEGLLTEADFKALDKEVTAETKAAVDEASASPEPHPRDVYKYVFQDLPAFATKPEELVWEDQPHH